MSKVILLYTNKIYVYKVKEMYQFHKNTRLQKEIKESRDKLLKIGNYICVKASEVAFNQQNYILIYKALQNCD